MVNRAALAGIRVVDLSEVMQGPLATQILADFGAEVIKIERPGKGDIMRSMDPKATAAGLISAHFAALNRHKQSVCLNLKDPGDLDQLLALIETADVLVSNYRPGVMERLGLGYEALQKTNPGLIYATAYGFGPTGPLAQKAGQDLVAQSISGLAMQRPSPDADPYLHPIPFVDYASGVSLTLSIMMALFERTQSGCGQQVSISLFDTSVAIQTLEATSQLMYGRTPNWVADHFPNQAFMTKDGWLAVVGFFRDNPLQSICQAFEIEDLSDRPEFATAALQAENRTVLNEMLAPEFASRELQDCLERLERMDVLCAPILSLAQTLEHPQVLANAMIAEVHTATQSDLKTVANPLRLARTPAISNGAVPELGRDSIANLIDTHHAQTHTGRGASPQNSEQEAVVETPDVRPEGGEL